MTLDGPSLQRAVLLGAAGLALQGCVAAAAIPLVAGGAIARTATDEKPGSQVDVERSAAPVAELAVPAVPTAVEGVTPGLIEPAAPPVRQSAELSEFIRYSTSRAFAFSQGTAPLPTAVLSEPSALDGKRLACEQGDERQLAILIDLDPGEAMFGPDSPLPAASAALSLKVLRSEGVTIAWISENSAADADIIRDALRQTGLDPEAEDTLLLMRYRGDRKQTRRAEFAAETCLIAIAGDRREDFDELYEYLVNRNAALALEPLMNNGWFLIRPEPQMQTTASDEAADEGPALPDPDGEQDQ